MAPALRLWAASLLFAAVSLTGFHPSAVETGPRLALARRVHFYTFVSDREACDGQCTYCRLAHHHHQWARVRDTVARFVRRPLRRAASPEEEAVMAADDVEIKRLIAWSWEDGVVFECTIGAISLRLLSYGYTDPLQFVAGEDFGVVDFLGAFNSNTGVLDLLTSSWIRLLSGGWPIFRQLHQVSRKLRARLAGDEPGYPQLRGRRNACDVLDSTTDAAYRDLVLRALEAAGVHIEASRHDREVRDPALAHGVHFSALGRSPRCPAGRAVALAMLARSLVVERDMYSGSTRDPNNVVDAALAAAQDAVMSWATENAGDWSRFFDLLTTAWPIWQVLDDLSCYDSSAPCATRSDLRCFDVATRTPAACPSPVPSAPMRRTFAMCGEHDVCTQPPGFDRATWCVPFDRRPQEPPAPWLARLGHDDEDRVCSQCGQDGIIRALFGHVGFRQGAGQLGVGGRAPFFVEFGARKPGMLNSAALRELCGWEGLLMDAQPGASPHGGCRDCPGVTEVVVRERVTAENVAELFGKYAVPADFDLLTIDTDFNDYWLWRELLANGTFRPRVVAVDFNPDIAPDAALAVRYDPAAEWDGSVYTVASLLAYGLLARAHGYAFAYALEMGSHAFFVRADLLAPADRDLPLRAVRKASHPPDALRRTFVDVGQDFVTPGGGPDMADGALRDLRREIRTIAGEVRALREALEVGGLDDRGP